jgi:ribosome-binding factor A
MEQQSFRIQRINQLIWRELITIISKEIKDPRLQKISITEVITSRDLGYSKIFFNTSEEDKVVIRKLLEGASGFLRSRLAKNLKLRHTPELQFRYDHSQNTSNRIEELIAKLYG